MTKSTFYITTPIYYVNDVPHIGHMYTTLACDVIARYKRLSGADVMFLTGTDEHGQKIERSAQKAGIPPQQFTDQAALHFIGLCKTMNFSNDDFIRTSEERHTSYVRHIWTRLIENGNIYLGKYSGWYSVRDEAFYSASELIDGHAPSGSPVEWLEEPTYFFKLSAWQDRLLEFYEKHEDFIAPESRRNEVVSFVRSGLVDLSISRTSFHWGIPVPGDEEHVIYVWLDALFNYLSAIQSKEKYWPCDLHIVGKDILRFHAVYWPAFLMALDIAPPTRIFAHGWWTNEGEKISKSLGNTIDPFALVDKFGLDYVRYFFMKELPFGKDGNYSEQHFIRVVNADLANTLGNLIQRVLTFIHKNCDRKIPYHHAFSDEDIALFQIAYELPQKVEEAINEQALHRALNLIIELASRANEYVSSHAPWHLKNVDVERMETVLFVLTDVIRIIGTLLQPFMPQSAEKIFGILQIKPPALQDIGTKLECGHEIAMPSIIFPRI
ncbi:methionine--tRNA ligase [Rickettsiales endosymbiont of Peranema trichophorum]|uniref:methionine--tRNA ligase n=1 Tax=Rickettsiales endosymbiont of Peranema trichophorum TaxID=2486577 RepID=UPI0010238E5C|nr:methionine--tRNA ligase [Rickettsiales endosymbiont of Peranema trichophorum]RZI47245.1 methionine--tRNA ligase [Rickettsiales endosymbiont of Peranema trichophorum]